MDTFGRRRMLAPDARRGCQQLDVQLAEAEKREKGVMRAALVEQQGEFYRMRLRFRELRC